jgi:hypothetical protein
LGPQMLCSPIATDRLMHFSGQSSAAIALVPARACVSGSSMRCRCRRARRRLPADWSLSRDANPISIGLSLRQVQRLAAGDAPIPETVAMLLRLYIAGAKLPE